MINYAQILSNIASFAEVTAGVLGIAITVVTIIVQLAANRYTPKITDLFIRNRINIAVLSFYVLICLFSVWLAIFDASFYGNSIHLVVWIYIICVTASFLSIIPYFFYVFNFLHPESIINKLELSAMKCVTGAMRSNSEISKLNNTMFDTIECIGDIGMNSVATMDRSLGLACIKTLKRILIGYFAHKSRLPAQWFSIGRENFLGFCCQSMTNIIISKTWVEVAILKQYEFLLAKSVAQIREFVQEISNAMLGIGIASVREHLPEATETSIVYFNTFLRIAYNERNQYAIYNIFGQYRMLAEEILPDNEEGVIEIAKYFKYYGQLALQYQMPFVLVIASHDLRKLNEKAYQIGFSMRDELLQIFLELDKPPETESEEIGLRGVRKSQAILAAFYLENNEEELARRIFDDMAYEPRERLISIRDEILGVEKERFWEITDRWVNFDYIPPKRKQFLTEFFRWFYLH